MTWHRVTEARILHRTPEQVRAMLENVADILHDYGLGCTAADLRELVQDIR